MSIQCTVDDNIPGSKVVAQQLFLGSSISSFSSTLGWNGTASNLSVDLIDDTSTTKCVDLQGNALPIFPAISNNNLNHYYDCLGNDCYIDENGNAYDPKRVYNPEFAAVGLPQSARRVAKGKVYHVLTASGLSSKYWIDYDPGFFGNKTEITDTGAYTKGSAQRYNIIGAPVYFRFGYLEFGGFVKDWECNNRLSTRSYTVNIEGPESLLNDCKVIVSEYGGSVYARFGSNPYGGPTNYTGKEGNYVGSLDGGNLANVFNVYGFLESYGFGTSNCNEKGIPLAYILNALSVLTSSSISQSQAPILFPNLAVSSTDTLLGYQRAFSPFGRILSPAVLKEGFNTASDLAEKGKPTNFGDNGFGIVDGILTNSVKRVPYLLDLSEIPRPPLDVRYNGSSDTGVTTIKDIITEACEKTGRDFYTIIIRKDGANFIKVKTVDRRRRIPGHAVENLISSLETAGLPVSTSSYGQVKNQEVTPRVLYAGAKQQRLFQAKSYLLGYSNTHLIYHPVLKKFVDYYRFGGTQGLPGSSTNTAGTRNRVWSIPGGSKWVDSFRVPMAYSTRNIAMCSTVNTPFISSIWGAEQIAASTPPWGSTFGGILDPNFKDTPVGGSVNLYTGNYWAAETSLMIAPSAPSGTTAFSCGSSTAINSPPATRFIPLYHYAISPFFGYAHDQYVPINLTKGSNNYRFIRPVYLDTWTGSITIAFRPNEAPLLSLGNIPRLYQTRFPENGGTNPNSGGGINSGTTSAGVPVPAPVDMTKTVGPSGYAPASGTLPAGASGVAPTQTLPIPYSRTQAYAGYSFSEIGFTVTETELRAACAGLDNYLAYCLQKASFSKPDLFEQLVAVYRDKGKLFVSSVANANNPNTGNGIGSADKLSIDVRTANMNGPAAGLKGATQNVHNNPLSYNFDWVLNHEFIKDLQIIVNFLKNLHDTHYGRTYIVRLPEVLAYQDKQYAPILVGPASNEVYAYKGSGKIFFNYEICNEGAWEEFQNYIDDSIMIGSPNYYKLSESNGLIKPLLGYNATPVRDYVSSAWCALDVNTRISKWKSVVADAHTEANDAKDFLAANADSPADAARGAIAYDIAVAKYKVAKKQLNRLGATLRDCSNLVVPSLDISNLENGEFIFVAPGDVGRKDPYDLASVGNNFILDDAALIQSDQALAGTSGNPTTAPALSKQTDLNTAAVNGSTKTYKLYIKSECAENFAFLDPIRLLGPRAIISSPGVNLYNSSMSYTQDPNNTILSNASAEDYGILNAMQKLATGSSKKVSQFGLFLKKITAGFSFINKNTVADGAVTTEDCAVLIDNIYAILLGNMVSIFNTNYLLPQRSSTNNVTNTHLSICPKKANPMFAAIPLKNNTACYGPWTNYPELITDDRLFAVTEAGIPNDRKANIRENLIFKTDVKINNGWAPWEYGGMAFLDREILNQIDMTATYQSVIEQSTLTMLGMPAFSLSGGLRIRQTESNVHNAFSYNFGGWSYWQLNALEPNYNGLVLSRISTSVSDKNILTTYNFETYKQRLGIYGKEISDMNKKFATTRIYLLNQIADVEKRLNNKLLLDADSIIRLNRTNEPKAGAPLKTLLWGKSPTELLIGSASYYVPIVGLPSGSLDPGLNNANYNALIAGATSKLGLSKALNNVVRTKNFVGNFTTIEGLTELSKQFTSKAVMSLDGLFSPVSFYPTDNLGTYAISSRCSPAGSGIPERRPGTICPMCNNTGKYNYTNGGSATEIACLLCAKSRVAFPSGQYDDEYDAPAINLVSLQPIVVPYGDFKNPNSQISSSGLERSRHNISVVGRQDSVQVGAQSLNLNNNLTNVANINGISNVELNMSGTAPAGGVNPDYYDMDLSSNINMLSNNRFFAFRGPMMLHGWGYDVNGFPVPNKADEPEFDNLGRPKRFVLTSSGTNDLTKAGKFIPATNELLGDIIGKGYTQENGEWTKKPTRFFHLNWAERSDLWPIGPIDFRWDDERKVWTAPKGCEELYPPYVVSTGTDVATLSQFLKKRKTTNNCPYKMVNITLEEDMTLINDFNETFPARAFIDDAEYSSEMLPINTRRLVYVKDKSSYTAPRGAKLLCRYDKDTGFYEPVTKQAFIVFGTRTTGNNAVVDLKYIQGLKSGENAQRITITFDNSRFNFNLSSNNRKGMFLYENGQWILIGSN